MVSPTVLVAQACATTQCLATLRERGSHKRWDVAGVQNEGSDMDDAVYVVDGFLSDPKPLRQLALEADYLTPPTPETYAGRNSARKYPLSGVDEHIAAIVGHRVVPLDIRPRTRIFVCASSTRPERAVCTSIIAIGLACCT